METWQITPKGWEVAKDVYVRYMETEEPIESIAESYGVTVEAISAFMSLAFDGGVVSFDDDRGSEGVE